MKRIIHLFILLAVAGMLAVACSKIDFEAINNLNNGKIEVIGHAGAGFQSLINPHPSNSFKSITYAIDAMNADGIEVDVEITSDSVLMAYHDVTLEHSTNCFGCVSKLPSSYVENCQYYNQYGAQVAHEAFITRFSGILDHFKNRSRKPHIYLNLKIDAHCTDMNTQAYKELWSKVVAKAIRENDAYSWITVYDSDLDLLAWIKNADPDIEICYNAQTFAGAIEACNTQGIKELLIGNDYISKEQVADVHSHGIKVILWGLVSRKSVVEAINKSPDGLMTDNIPLTQECLQD